MSTDSTRGAGLEPDWRPVPVNWDFREARMERRELAEPVLVPRGIESIRVTHAVDVRLAGTLDPGAAQWYDSYLPTLRIGGAQSSRMTRNDDSLRFTFYPDVDGDIEGGPIEFRARLDDEFEPTGLDV